VQAATATVIDTTLPRIPSCAAFARRLVASSLGPVLDHVALGGTEVVVSELVENAYLHGHGKIEVLVAMNHARVRVGVTDEGDGASKVLKQRDEGACGLGLTMVDELSAAWGAHPGSTHVWAEVQRPVGF
jgi:anti-sigma regulatory factor (Ser/Thr protein kinase)